MTARLQDLVEIANLLTNDISGRIAKIHETLLRESQWLETGNFRRIYPDDVRRLFDEYDRLFFDGGCRRALGETRLEFRLSKRMTRSAGKTIRYTSRTRSQRPFYEIAVSTALLFQAFQEGDHPVTVSGVLCGTRLEALQRVVEHEMLHLVEMLVWNGSSCAASRFQSMASRLFGHTAHTRALITPRERPSLRTGSLPVSGFASGLKEPSSPAS